MRTLIMHAVDGHGGWCSVRCFDGVLLPAVCVHIKHRPKVRKLLVHLRVCIYVCMYVCMSMYVSWGNA